MIRIFLIRHGESIQNSNENYDNTPSHLVSLTEKGKKQAEECGKFLKDYTNQNNLNIEKSILYVSLFARTRETAKIINKHLKINSIKEDIALVEQQHGLFENIPYTEWEKFGKEYEHYQNYYENNGKFYAKFPQGESPFDVAIRMRQFIITMLNDIDENTENIYIVSHGTAIRMFILSYFNHPPEWFETGSSMENCSVRLIERQSHNHSIDKGYIYGKRKKPNKTTAKNPQNK